MAFDSFRDFLRVLEEAGELTRITQPVATELEITELADRQMKSPDGGKALLSQKPSARTRRRALPGVGVSLILLLLIGVGCRKSPPDPMINGQPLSQWIERYDPAITVPEGSPRDRNGWSLGWDERFRERWQTSLRAREAIRSAGTNALPLLLDYIWRTDNPIAGSYKGVMGKRTAHDYNRLGEYGFDALGELAVPAIPSLEKLATLGGGKWAARTSNAEHALRSIESASKARATQGSSEIPTK
ncbi:MAG: UbiD family decarboxylase [Verrucomicrobia bacterium]|nr:UbiD family decarboxylase [Verrucomicrobiota bacterium]